MRQKQAKDAEIEQRANNFHRRMKAIRQTINE